jgi:AbrB-like transcriptional regulator
MSRKKKELPSMPLVGEALIKKVKELDHLSKEDKARTCGYSTPNAKGGERVNMMKFQKALLDASGLELDGKPEAGSRGGRHAGYRITVQANGNLLIGSAYTKQMDLKAGDEFEITLGRKQIKLKLVNEQEPSDEF